MPLYKDVCDLEITGDDDPDILVDKILDEVKKNG